MIRHAGLKINPSLLILAYARKVHQLAFSVRMVLRPCLQDNLPFDTIATKMNKSSNEIQTARDQDPDAVQWHASVFSGLLCAMFKHGMLLCWCLFTRDDTV